MAKKIIQRYLPDSHRIKENRYLQFLGSALYNANLWQLNRRSAATAFFIGIFVAFIPMPFQMVPAACLAILFRCNLPLSVALVWITNPFTMPAIFYFTYKIGCLILQVPVSESSFELTLQGLGSGLVRIWKPLYLGSVITGLILGLLNYMMIRIIWRWNVVVNWRQRNKRRVKPNSTN
ncbi:MAG: DUF2062 domain-containing protein [Endozoicomonas sp.]